MNKSFILNSIPNFIKYNFLYIYKLFIIIRSDKWSKEKIERYQLNKINSVIENFRGKIDEYPTEMLSKIEHIKDIEKFPIVDKSLMRKHSTCIATSGSNIYKANTGGTTGSPLVMYKARADINYEKAFVDSVLYKSGVNIFLPYRSIRLRGDNIEGVVKKTGINKYSLSSYKISSGNIDSYIRHIKKIRADVIFCYPSSLYILAKEILNTGRKEKFSIRCIIFSSEVLLPHQLDIIKKVFDAKFINLFGNTEHTIFAVDELDGKGFNISKLYSYVESISGRLITTSFNDRNMLFLRYDTGDSAIIKDDGEIELGGRKQDVLIGKNGEIFPVVGLFFGQHFDIFNVALECQILQRKKGFAEVNVYSLVESLDVEMDELKAKISSATFGNLDVVVNISRKPITRTRSGKLQFLVSEINYE